jgi:hypothetical protein
VGAALEEAALGDPPVEGVKDAPARACSLRAAALTETPIRAHSPVLADPTLWSARLLIHHPTPSAE